MATGSDTSSVKHIVAPPQDVPGLDVVLDGQFGSTGKGLLASVLAEYNSYHLFMTNNGPNAGHTAYYGDRKIVAKQLPVGAIYQFLKTGVIPLIYLNAGAIIEPTTLIKECQEFGIAPSEVIIHPNAAVIWPEHIEEESDTSSGAAKIASTGKGVGAALAAKIQRKACNIAKTEPRLELFDRRALRLDRMIQDGLKALYEIPQGFSLGINSEFYPNVTSRECNVMQGLSDAHVHPDFVRRTYMCIRTYPIRVGNTSHGYSGDCYPDQKEVTWEEIKKTPETTTVTGRVRRVFTFSDSQYGRALSVNRPNVVFANFMNYLTEEEQTAFSQRLMNVAFRDRHIPALLYGRGPRIEDVGAW